MLHTELTGPVTGPTALAAVVACAAVAGGVQAYRRGYVYAPSLGWLGVWVFALSVAVSIYGVCVMPWGPPEKSWGDYDSDYDRNVSHWRESLAAKDVVAARFCLSAGVAGMILGAACGFMQPLPGPSRGYHR